MTKYIQKQNKVRMMSFGYLDLLVFYCCVTNYYKLSGFKNIHLFAQSSKIWHSVTLSSAEGVSLTEFSSQSTEKGSTTKIIQVLAKFIFLCV